jgi:hypothetical protein
MTVREAAQSERRIQTQENRTSRKQSTWCTGDRDVIHAPGFGRRSEIDADTDSANATSRTAVATAVDGHRS